MGWRKWILLTCVLTAFISYRVYIVQNRQLPAGIENPSVVRWLDEGGRIINSGMWICHQLGVEVAVWPVKAVVNFGFRLLLNGVGHRITNMTVHYTSVDGVPVTIFKPDLLAAEDRHVTMVYFHGGGWTWLSVDVYAGYLANLATRAKVQIVAPEYRKAPQFPFPAAYEDCLAVTNGLLKRTKTFRIRPGHVLVAGDGAGGNLAAAVALNVRGKILAQVLINPALQVIDFETPSYQDNVDTLPGLSSNFRDIYNWLTYGAISKDYLQLAMQNNHVPKKVRYSAFSTYVDSERYLQNHLGVTNKKTKPPRSSNFLASAAFTDISTDPRYAPMMVFDTKEIPNAYIMTSQYDVFRDEAIMYGQRLFNEGVNVKLEHYFEAFHGFFLFNGHGGIRFNVSKDALDALVEFMEINVHKSMPLKEPFQD